MQIPNVIRLMVLLPICFFPPKLLASPSDVGFSPFAQAVAETAASDDKVAAFYLSTNYQPIWTGTGAVFLARRQALLEALDMANLHGLPAERYNSNEVLDVISKVKTVRDLAQAEYIMTRSFLRLSRDLSQGVLDPAQVNPAYKRSHEAPDPAYALSAFKQTTPRSYFKSLLPATNEYSRLVAAKSRLEATIISGGWGARVSAPSLKPNDQGASVVALRDRLVAMGYLQPTATQIYDQDITTAVRAFQEDHGLTGDGVAGADTIREINTPAETRLKSVLVALERERWMNTEREPDHVWVNITDFSARIIKDDVLKFETRSVVGKNENGRRTPEFSDELEFMVINPTWNVPRSIVVKEYLPRLKRNRNAAGHLDLYNSRGQKVSRGAVNFGAYNARNFPFAMKQKPSARNALGLVKFMFPNKYNIYLHDTPSKDLFNRQVRAFSHGCIRLQKPFEFAYALLSSQAEDPKRTFHSHLSTGRESVVRLDKSLPVHLIYRTAFTSARGRVSYRKDVYGRDARIWDALNKAGVELPSPQEGET